MPIESGKRHLQPAGNVSAGESVAASLSTRRSASLADGVDGRARELDGHVSEDVIAPSRMFLPQGVAFLRKAVYN